MEKLTPGEVFHLHGVEIGIYGWDGLLIILKRSVKRRKENVPTRKNRLTDKR
jgi:hypothetical protein